MGSCISKCRPKRRKFKPNCSHEEDFSHVHDKLVISQAPVSPTPLLIHKPVSPSPSAASSTTVSSFSGATTSTSSGFSVASSLSTSSSSSSSVSISKDRSFSNEFLWSCAKENPHIIGRSLIKGKVHPQILESPSREKPVVMPLKQAIPEKLGGSSTPKKRARTNSPTVVRQKSFRKEPDWVSSTSHLPCRTLRSPSPRRGLNADHQSFRESCTSRTPRSPSPSRGSNTDHQSFRESFTSKSLRSPSPSRRFNGDQSFRDSFTSAMKDIHSKRSTVSKTSSINSSSSSLRKDSFRGPSANFDSKDGNVLLKSTRDPFCHQIDSKIDENPIEEEKQDQDVEAIIIEDFNNPLIALDCFIFL